MFREMAAISSFCWVLLCYSFAVSRHFWNRLMKYPRLYRYMLLIFRIKRKNRTVEKKILYLQEIKKNNLLIIFDK